MNVLQQSMWTGVAALKMDDPGVRPNKDGLPGLSVLKDLVGGLLVFGLVLCVAGVVISAIVWAIGSNSSNHHAASRGKTGVLVGVAAAIVVGGANALVRWGSGIGGTL